MYLEKKDKDTSDKRRRWQSPLSPRLRGKPPTQTLTAQHTAAAELQLLTARSEVEWPFLFCNFFCSWLGTLSARNVKRCVVFERLTDHIYEGKSMSKSMHVQNKFSSKSLERKGFLFDSEGVQAPGYSNQSQTSSLYWLDFISVELRMNHFLTKKKEWRGWEIKIMIKWKLWDKI